MGTPFRDGGLPAVFWRDDPAVAAVASDHGRAAAPRAGTTVYSNGDPGCPRRATAVRIFDNTPRTAKW